MNLKNRILIVLALVAGIQFAVPAEIMACPTCKSGFEDGTAFAFAFSILFMMAMPFLIMTFWIVTILRLRASASEASVNCPST